MSDILARYLVLMGVLFVAYSYLAALSPFIKPADDGFRASWREPAHVLVLVFAPIFFPVTLLWEMFADLSGGGSSE